MISNRYIIIVNVIHLHSIEVPGNSDNLCTWHPVFMVLVPGGFHAVKHLSRSSYEMTSVVKSRRVLVELWTPKDGQSENLRNCYRLEYSVVRAETRNAHTAEF